MLNYEQVNQLAIKAGFSPAEVENWVRHQALAEFVKLIAERCASVCDVTGEYASKMPKERSSVTAQRCAQIIRNIYVN